jgi:hypothetical protein
MSYTTMGAIVVAILILVGVCSIYFMGKDNAVEQTCEHGIEAISGDKVDLSGPDDAAK